MRSWLGFSNTMFQVNNPRIKAVSITIVQKTNGVSKPILWCMKLCTPSSIVSLSFWTNVLVSSTDSWSFPVDWEFFGQNPLRRRKILPETACRSTFQLSRAYVLPSLSSKGKGRMTESGDSQYRRLMIDQIQILPWNNEKYTVLLLVYKNVLLLFQDELYINANHASM